MSSLNTWDFFNKSLAQVDPDIFSIVGQELDRQRQEIQLIASENIVSRAVLEAQGSILTNKYAEGYSGKRYYGGCHYIDVIEDLAIERAKKLFDVNFVNVQPHSGSQMNQAVFLALLNPGDKFMGLDLNSGGHLTHGAPVNLSGKWFDVVPYSVSRDNHILDMDEIEDLAIKSKPKLIMAGGSSYPRFWDWQRFRKIADIVGAYFVVDMAHIAGLVAGGQHLSPIPHAHVVTTTVHKSLRGPRGGMIMTNDEKLAAKINSAIFPGLQGGPLMHIIASKAVAFKEALRPEFKEYTSQVVKNSKTLAKKLKVHGFNIVSGDTDNHIVLVNLKNKNLTGKAVEAALGRVYITCNKNSIPFDLEKPYVTSGIRLGSPAATTRGFKEAEFEYLADLIAEVVLGISSVSDKAYEYLENDIRNKVNELIKAFPIYDYLD
ncbi:Serine hydroxymethyltransferase [Liberibacter crescens BT-1]|uniref:Serine hydroxymethyltransferase n=1 Tax=Liberibacter crescens (strain BT-1) TaxID=1215343 RepID=L0EXI5_LIBCB|nr:serine hydroxymethyltransferase [Liberibacter crescens]AGA65081.1 Serine hydroxymethyltransferase [Liberibacter crescens BT-1]AMC13067.1 serine hydroxymethyltransferase [Liberibacter crescens]